MVLDTLIAVVLAAGMLGGMLWLFFWVMDQPDPKWDQEFEAIARMHFAQMEEYQLRATRIRAQLLEQEACFENDTDRIRQAQELMVAAEDEIALRRRRVSRVQLLMDD